MSMISIVGAGEDGSGGVVIASSAARYKYVRTGCSSFSSSVNMSSYHVYFRSLTNTQKTKTVVA